MTKVQLQFDLTKPLTDAMLRQIDRVHGIYGMSRVQVLPDGGLLVDYDASRLGPQEVESVLRMAGIPARPRPVA